MKNIFTSREAKGKRARFLTQLALLAAMLFCINLSAQNVWIGNTDANWATASNWSIGSVPIDTQDVVIPTSSNNPIISGATAAIAKSVTVQSGAALTVTGSLTIDNSDFFAIHNQGTVNNNGALNFGTVASVANQGILNYGTFNNNSTGDINIDRAFAGITNYTGTFTNNGTITIGEASGINGPGIYNEAAFSNEAGAEVHIVKAAATGIDNRVGSSCSNLGLLTIGINGSINGPAIYNFIDFTNGAEGEIKIENSFYGIDHRNNATFDNLGIITIGADAPVQNSAIYNEATFSNTNATINVDSAHVAIDNRSTGVFNNTGTITIGANHAVDNIGIHNQGDLSNDGGTINIDQILRQSGIYSGFGASINNNGTITIGGEGEINDQGLVNYGLFQNQSAAELSINRVASEFGFSVNGVYNGSSATFQNWGKLYIGNEDGAFGQGLYNVNIFENYSGAEIIIDHVTGEFANGLYNEDEFTNAGSIHIGDAVDAGKFGLITSFSSTFNNDQGEITINNVRSGENTHALYIRSTFTNSGTIRIGNIANESDWGLFNTGTLNNTGGTITIDNTALAGMRNQNSGTISNSGQISIGQTGAVGDWGLWNVAILNNQEDGLITIDQSAIIGLLNQDGTFNNYGEIGVGTNTGVTQYAFWNDNIFNNLACGAFEIAAAFSNEDDFVNTGLMIVNTADVHANTGFENDGVIAYPQNNPIPNVTNNEIIVTPVSTDCGEVTPAIDLAAMIDLTIANTWYQDEALTTVAGTYDQPSNTFTFTASPAATTSTLYFSATSTADNCSMTVPIEVTFTDEEAPTISCPAPQTLVLGEDCTAMLEDYTALATATDNCDVVTIKQSPEAGTTVSGVGNETITLTAFDLKGLSNSCTFSVEKVDQTAPTALCQNTTVQLDANGMGSIPIAIVTDNIDNGSFDGCGLAAMNALTLDVTSFTCAEVGDNTVTLTVLDASGNDNSCTAIVTVEDNVAPNITICEGNFAVFNGEESIDVSTVISLMANDACGTNTTFTPSVITCDQLGSNVNVLVTVTDPSGNTNNCTAVVKTDGLPCGFMDFGDNGIDCEDSSNVEYNTETESFTLISDGCATNNFAQDNAAYTFTELCGDGEIIAHVTDINPLGQGWAGVTLRESEDPGSKKVELLSNLGNILRRAIRTTTNGYAYPAQFFRPQATWLKLVRNGNLFIGYASFDGINWQNVLYANIPMNECIQAGLMVTNYNGSTVVSGTFDNVQVNGSGSMNLQIPENEGEVVAQDINLFPNPTKDQIFIDLNSFQGQEIELTIFNQQGQMISRRHIKEVGSHPEELDLNQMTAGSYYIQISTDKGEVVKRFSIVK